MQRSSPGDVRAAHLVGPARAANSRHGIVNADYSLVAPKQHHPDLEHKEIPWPTGLNTCDRRPEPTREIPRPRSSPTALPDCGYDGSTNQATGDNSDVVLKPVFQCPDPIRGGDNILVLCETLLTSDMSPHPTNTRAAAVEAMEKYGDQEPWFGLEQEYTLLDPITGWPAGFPAGGFPAPQGPYYCGVGAVKIHGRELIEAHTTACIEAGLAISGTNARPPLPVGIPDRPGRHRHRRRPPVGRPLPSLPSGRGSRCRGLDRGQADEGDWNGAGMHTNFSTKAMVRATTRSSPPVRRWVPRVFRRSQSLRATAWASRTVSPVRTRPSASISSATAP